MNTEAEQAMSPRTKTYLLLARIGYCLGQLYCHDLFPAQPDKFMGKFRVIPTACFIRARTGNYHVYWLYLLRQAPGHGTWFEDPEVKRRPTAIR